MRTSEAHPPTRATLVHGSFLSSRFDDLEVRRDLVIPKSEIVEAASRSSGPGGQHVNKSNTRVTLRWNLETSRAVGSVRKQRLRRKLAGRLTRSGDVVVHAGRHRSRARNRELARERLADLIRQGVALPRKRRATKPSRAEKEKVLASKRHASRRKELRRKVDPKADS